MIISNKKPLTSSETTKRSVQKRKDTGLMQIKVWVADQKDEKNPDVITEADKVRAYAAKQPLTKSILRELKK